ncbi:YciI family protein [Bacteroidota bacterium]
MKSFRSLLVLLLLASLVLSCGKVQKSEYFVFLNINPDKAALSEAEVETFQGHHMDNLEKLAEEGDLVASGPFQGGGGMLVLLAESQEKALEHVNSDPAVQAGLFLVEVFPLSFIKGSICPWWQPVDMGSYGFFRFRQGSIKNKERLQDHFYCLSVLEDEPRVLVQADFDDSGSGILILDQPLSDDWIEKVVDNQAIQEGVIEVDIKTLLIARGTFCD